MLYDLSKITSLTFDVLTEINTIITEPSVGIDQAEQ